MQPWGRKKVLVVGGRAWVIRRALVNLERAGWHVVVAATLPEAWRRIAADRPDMVLLDVMDRQQDVFALLRRLKADPATAEIPVLMIGDGKGEQLCDWPPVRRS